MPKGFQKNGVPVVALRKLSNPATEHPTSLDIAWAAGLYEGEGSSNFTHKSQECEETSIPQKDPWVLHRMKALFGGTVTPKKNYGPIGEDGFRWRCSGPRARGFLMTIYKFLSPRRQEQIHKLGFLRA